jgi:hypothetical protein
MAFEPIAAAYEKEHRLEFAASDPSGPHVVASGSVNVAAGLKGNPDEDFYAEYDVYLVVGPWWKDVRTVVPFVTVNGAFNENIDEDDSFAWNISDLTWDTVGGTGPNIDEERIRLKFKVAAKGENTVISRIAYYLTARGRELGHLGLKSP